MLKHVSRFNLESLRKCVSAGERLPAAVFEEWRKATGISIIDGIGNWMKEGAMSGDLERAKTAYADFVTNAHLANVDAAVGDEIKKELEELMEEAKLQNCPTPQIPNYDYYTFDIQPFGMGAFKGQQAPTMRLQPAGGSGSQWDMFGRNSSPL